MKRAIFLLAVLAGAPSYAFDSPFSLPPASSGLTALEDGTTTITGGSDGEVLYNNGGVVEGNAGLTVSDTGRLTTNVKSGLPVNVGGRLFTVTASSGNTVSVDTTLYSYTIPANTMDTAGEMIYAVFHGTTTATSTSRTIKITVGGQTCFSAPITLNAQDWEISCRIYVTGTNTQRFVGRAIFDASSGSTFSDSKQYYPQTLTASSAHNIVVSVLSAGASNDTLLHTGYGEIIP